MFSARGVPLESPALCFWKFFHWLADASWGFPGGNGNPLQCSCLENYMGRGVWQARVISSSLLKIQEGGWGNNSVPFWSKTLVITLTVSAHSGSGHGHRAWLHPQLQVPANISTCCYLVAQLYLTLCDPLDLPGSSVHGILQARILAISFSRGSSWPRDRTCVSCIGRWVLYCLSHQRSPQNPGQLERWGKHTRNRRFFVRWRKRERLWNLILQYKIIEALFLPPRCPLTKDSIFFSRAGEGNRVSRIRWAGFSGLELDLLSRAPAFCHPILLSPPLRTSTSDICLSGSRLYIVKWSCSVVSDSLQPHGL